MVSPRVQDFILPRLRDHDYEIATIRTLQAKIKSEPLNFATADPVIDTPPHIKKAMIEALRRPDASHYARIRGLPEFVTAVSEFYRRFDVRVDPMSQIVVTNGAGEALYIVFASITAPGDEFILPNPTFPNYASILELQGGKPRFVPVRTDFHLDPEAIRKGVTRRTKAIVICTPNNPTGAVYDRSELEEVLEIARGNNLLLISDESYSQVTYDGKEHVSIASLRKAMERTIVVNGLSKAYAMTGWRLGYIIARSELTEQFEKLAFEIRGSVNTAVQYAGIAALRTPKTIIDRIVRGYDRRRRLAVQLLREAGLECHIPEGGFETFPKIPSNFKNSMDFAGFLAERASVLVKPGNYFGPQGKSNFRLVFCKDEDTIVEGIKRIKEAIGSSSQVTHRQGSG
ncbi:MAG: pyridoxal phosphate-dependent aminotransferase [Thaumarchaeota archaeon]|nr:pyridoxal phosphate-dependent aminotransferase [Nitrososphaerota archaeon]